MARKPMKPMPNSPAEEAAESAAMEGAEASAGTEGGPADQAGLALADHPVLHRPHGANAPYTP